MNFGRPRLLPSILACLVFGGCASTSGSGPAGQSIPAAGSSAPALVQAGAPGASSRTVSTAPTGRPPAVHTAADVSFMQGMIGHHAQALVMTEMVPSRSNSDGMRLLARRIEVSQDSEIEMMGQWLRQRGETVPGTHDHMHHLMPGMLSDAQLAEMRAATGVEFERLFLRYMIGHHEGALTMVAELFASEGAAQDADIYQFASDVDSDQRMEIRRMQQMLDEHTPTENR